MIYLFHGDDQVRSRQAIPRGRRHYDLAELTPEKLEQIMAGNELFRENQDVYLWAGKKLTAAQIKTIPDAQVKEFVFPRILWQFLRTLKLADLELCLKTEAIELVWYLLHRQAGKSQQTELLKKMYAIELALKSGKSDVPLRTQLELLLLSYESGHQR